MNTNTHLSEKGFAALPTFEMELQHDTFLDSNMQPTQPLVDSNFYRFLKWHNYPNTIATIAILIAVILYQRLFELCPYKTDGQCVTNFLLPKVPYLISQGVMSAVLFIGVCIMAIRKSISKYFVGVECIILIYLLGFQGHVISTNNYQMVYQIFYLLILAILIMVLLTMQLIRTIYRKLGIYSIIIGLGICSIMYIYTHKVMEGSCSKWNSGLSNMGIINDEAYCQITEPSTCWYDMLDGALDATKLYDCTKDKPNKSKWLETLKEFITIPDNTKYIEFPRTEYFEDQYRFLPYMDYQQYYLSKLQFRNNITDISSECESYFDIEQMQYKTKIKRNETTIQQRSKLFNSQQNKIKDRKMPKNVITIWVDAVSRARFMQKLPNSMKWFEEQVLLGSTILFQGFRYICISIHTTLVYLAYEYGHYFESDDLKEHYEFSLLTGLVNSSDTELVSLSQQFMDAGYIVGKSRTLCGSSVTEMEPAFSEVIVPQPVDHEFVGHSCDPNYQNPSSPFGLFQGPYSIYRKCLYGQEVNQYSFDYAKDFLQTYEDVPKYLELYYLDGHEGTGEAITYFDDPLRNFLDWLSNNDMIEDSMIVLLSDHGLHMQGLFYVFGLDVFDIELALPAMFILLDQDLVNNKLQQNLYANQQQAITIFELHHMMKYMIEADTSVDQQYYKDSSLLTDQIEQQRWCGDIPKPKSQYCPCISTQQ